jgi:hypothetical protein
VRLCALVLAALLLARGAATCMPQTWALRAAASPGLSATGWDDGATKGDGVRAGLHVTSREAPPVPAFMKRKRFDQFMERCPRVPRLPRGEARAVGVQQNDHADRAVRRGKQQVPGQDTRGQGVSWASEV